MRRSWVTSSSPLGVSRIFIDAAKRGSRMIRRNGSAPSDAFGDELVAVAAGAERRLRVVEVEAAEPLQADRVLPPPPDAVVVAHAGRSPPNRGGRCRRRRRPGRRTSSPIAARSAASSSNVLPSAVPVPAVVSSSTPTGPGTAARQRGVSTRRCGASPAVAVVDEVARMGDDRRGCRARAQRSSSARNEASERSRSTGSGVARLIR